MCFPADINVPPPEGGATAGSTPQPEQQCQGTAPVTLFLSPLAFSTHLLNPKCQLYPFVVRQDPALQLFCCKPKGKAKSVCVSLFSQLSCSLLGACSAPRNISKSQCQRKQTCLCLPVHSHLTCPAMAGGRRPKYTRFVGAGLVLKTNPKGNTSPPYWPQPPLHTPALCGPLKE